MPQFQRNCITIETMRHTRAQLCSMSIVWPSFTVCRPYQDKQELILNLAGRPAGGRAAAFDAPVGLKVLLDNVIEYR